MKVLTSNEFTVEALKNLEGRTSLLVKPLKDSYTVVHILLTNGTNIRYTIKNNDSMYYHDSVEHDAAALYFFIGSAVYIYDRYDEVVTWIRYDAGDENGVELTERFYKECNIYNNHLVDLEVDTNEVDTKTVSDIDANSWYPTDMFKNEPVDEEEEEHSGSYFLPSVKATIISPDDNGKFDFSDIEGFDSIVFSWVSRPRIDRDLYFIAVDKKTNNRDVWVLDGDDIVKGVLKNGNHVYIIRDDDSGKYFVYEETDGVLGYVVSAPVGDCGEELRNIIESIGIISYNDDNEINFFVNAEEIDRLLTEEYESCNDINHCRIWLPYKKAEKKTPKKVKPVKISIVIE